MALSTQMLQAPRTERATRGRRPSLDGLEPQTRRAIFRLQVDDYRVREDAAGVRRDSPEYTKTPLELSRFAVGRTWITSIAGTYTSSPPSVEMTMRGRRGSSVAVWIPILRSEVIHALGRPYTDLVISR